MTGSPERLWSAALVAVSLGYLMVSSVACGAAPGIGALVVARLVQGVGAAAAVPASLALLRAAYPRPAARARAIGVWGGVAGVAAAVGPVLGGVLVTALGWRAVFFVNAPVGLAAIGLTARGVPAPRPRPRGLDPAAQVTSVLALAALTYALIEAGRSGRTPVAVGAALVAAASGVAFVVVERRASCPMLPLDMFADRGFAGGNAVGLLINLGFYGQLFLVNLFFQQALGWSALRAGLALLPEMGMASIGSFLSGRVTGRAGSPRPAMVIGLLTGAAGLLGCSPWTSTSPMACSWSRWPPRGSGCRSRCPRPPRPSWTARRPSGRGSRRARSTPPDRSAGSSGSRRSAGCSAQAAATSSG
jgi:MFS transporter, DHA2 family, methylenomycin A resistance protein